MQPTTALVLGAELTREQPRWGAAGGGRAWRPTGHHRGSSSGALNGGAVCAADPTVAGLPRPAEGRTRPSR